MDKKQEYPRVVEPVVDLNVGGRLFTTYLSTLTKEPDSKLATMFSGRHPGTRDKDGRFFIDVDGEIFSHILNFLRFECHPPTKTLIQVYDMSSYFGLNSLMRCLETYMPVQKEIQLRQIRESYPVYQSILTSVTGDFNKRRLKSFALSEIIEIGIKPRGCYMCSTCARLQNVIETTADDPDGVALRFLL